MKPILFNTEMVKAILEGRKTSTRRIIKNLSIKEYEAVTTNGKKYARYTLTDVDRYGEEKEDSWYDGPIKDISQDESIIQYAPYQVGDILYVRETFFHGDIIDPDSEEMKERGITLYRADGEQRDDIDYSLINWSPSIHMPKSMARIFLKVTDIKVQRLQDITEREVLKEGVKRYHFNMNMPDAYGDALYTDHKLAFKTLWNSTVNKKDIDKYGWNADPYVWAIEFQRVEKEE